MSRRAAARALVAALGLAALAGCVTRPAPPEPAVPSVEEPIEPITPVARPARRAPPMAPAEAPPPPPPRIADGQALFERLAAGLTPPVCVRGDHNRTWRRRYAGHPTALERQLRQALPLLGYVVEAVEDRDLPGEFALIPLVESGFRPEARGPGGPAGLWQMIGSTARNHGVQVRQGYDGRLSPVDATEAALDYLAALHAEFGDWRATAMAYNAGEGRLRRALARDADRRVSGERRLPTGLSGVTYAYVAKLHALACLIAEPERHGLSLPTDPFVPLEARTAPAGIARLDALARSWGTEPAVLARWNPAYRNGLPTGAPRRLLAPVVGKGASNEASASATPDGADDGPEGRSADFESRHHTVRRGDTLWAIARRYGTTVRAIAAMNQLRVDRPLRVGQRLHLPD